MAQSLLSTYARIMSCAQKTPFTKDGARPVCERTDIHFQAFLIGCGRTRKSPFCPSPGSPAEERCQQRFFACNCFCVCEAENIMAAARGRTLGAKLVRPFSRGVPLLRAWKARTAGVVFVTLMEGRHTSGIRMRGGKTNLVPATRGGLAVMRAFSAVLPGASLRG